MSQDYTKAIVKINRETKEDKISWNKVNLKPTSLSNAEVVSGFVYESRVLNKDVILYKYQYKYYTDEDEFHWVDGYRLDFVDGRNISEWTFPYNNATEDLYETVQFKQANVSDFLTEYLDEEEENNDLPF